MEFVDTNIFIRHLTNDDPVKARACFELFHRAEAGEVEIITTEAVIAEVVFILSSKKLYNVPRTTIRALLYPILSLQGLKLTHRKTYLRALDIYATHNLDFEDALIGAQMERIKVSDLFSYDRGFDKISGVNRIEP